MPAIHDQHEVEISQANKILEDIYHKGYAAYTRNDNNNPYSELSLEYSYWQTGWHKAQSNLQEIKNCEDRMNCYFQQAENFYQDEKRCSRYLDLAVTYERKLNEYKELLKRRANG